MREETEEEFLERYAAAAAGESIEIVEEGDIDDETQDIELGKLLEIFSLSYICLKMELFYEHSPLGANAGSLDEVDIQQVVLSLMQNHIALLQAQILPDGLIERIAETFPEYEQMFHVHRQA